MSESPASSRRGSAAPPFDAAFMPTDYQDALNPAEPLQLGVTAYQKGKREPHAPAYLDSGRLPTADMGFLLFWQKGT